MFQPNQWLIFFNLNLKYTASFCLPKKHPVIFTKKITIDIFLNKNKNSTYDKIYLLSISVYTIT